MGFLSQRPLKYTIISDGTQNQYEVISVLNQDKTYPYVQNNPVINPTF